MRPTHPCSSTATTIRGDPSTQGTHSIMSRFLSLAGVLVLAALAVADGPDSPAPRQQKGEVKLKAQHPAPSFYDRAPTIESFVSVRFSHEGGPTTRDAHR
jgi:hypothetical protein